MHQHAGIAQGVGLHAVEVEELGDPFVIGTEQFLVHLVRDRRPVDLVETVAREEPDREGQHENPPHPEFARAAQQRLHQPVADALSLAVRTYRDRPDLGQVLPHDMESPAPDDFAVGDVLRDPELLYVLVEGDGGLGEQPPGTDVAFHQRDDRPHVLGSRTSDRVFHCPHTLARVGNGSRPPAAGHRRYCTRSPCATGGNGPRIVTASLRIASSTAPQNIPRSITCKSRRWMIGHLSELTCANASAYPPLTKTRKLTVPAFRIPIRARSAQNLTRLASRKAPDPLTCSASQTRYPR